MSTEVLALLTECGEALYGTQWQSAIARDLGVSDRTVRRWVAATSSIPSGVHADLSQLVKERLSRLEALVGRLQEAENLSTAQE